MRGSLVGGLLGAALMAVASSALADGDIGLMVRGSGGPTYRTFNDTHLVGGALALAVGGEGERGGIHASADTVLGTTEVGLRSQIAHLGAGGELIHHRFRFGIGAHLSALIIARVSGARGALFTFGAGVCTFASFDVVKMPGLAVYVSAIVTADDFGKGDNPRSLVMWGPSSVVGIRF